jgi:hypothetical protein
MSFHYLSHRGRIAKSALRRTLLLGHLTRLPEDG